MGKKKEKKRVGVQSVGWTILSEGTRFLVAFSVCDVLVNSDTIIILIINGKRFAFCLTRKIYTCTENDRKPMTNLKLCDGLSNRFQSVEMAERCSSRPSFSRTTNRPQVCAYTAEKRYDTWVERCVIAGDGRILFVGIACKSEDSADRMSKIDF